MNRATAVLLAAVAALGPDVYAQAAEPSGRELVAQCLAYSENPASEQGSRCAAFIAGFLAGVAASDASARTAPETYSERALRTRLGLRLVGRPSGPCVDGLTSHEIVIGQLLAYAAERPPDGELAAGALAQEVLKRFYACDLLEHRRSL